MRNNFADFYFQIDRFKFDGFDLDSFELANSKDFLDQELFDFDIIKRKVENGDEYVHNVRVRDD